MAVKNGRLYRYDKPSDSFRLELDLRDNHPGISLYSICFHGSEAVALGTSEGVLFLTKSGNETRYVTDRIVKAIAVKGGGIILAGNRQRNIHAGERPCA